MNYSNKLDISFDNPTYKGLILLNSDIIDNYYDIRSRLLSVCKTYLYERGYSLYSLLSTYIKLYNDDLMSYPIFIKFGNYYIELIYNNDTNSKEDVINMLNYFIDNGINMINLDNLRISIIDQEFSKLIENNNYSQLTLFRGGITNLRNHRFVNIKALLCRLLIMKNFNLDYITDIKSGYIISILDDDIMNYEVLFKLYDEKIEINYNNIDNIDSILNYLLKTEKIL